MTKDEQIQLWIKKDNIYIALSSKLRSVYCEDLDRKLTSL